MKELLFVSALMLFVWTDAKPGVVTQKPVELQKSVNAEDNHVRVRRGNSDYGDYMSQKSRYQSVVDIGSGYNNRNTLYFSKGYFNTHNQSAIIIGRGTNNTNTVYFGLKPDQSRETLSQDHFGMINKNTKLRKSPFILPTLKINHVLSSVYKN
ncbi:uncharacterized protein LOC123866151 isoform X4 [Maniola jurtina]|uniref:uncharacterized protein LOC123866151 isoform X4 n=1 Tax=Maniola jurtina TaxID=191418 RepID=UPI001E68D284|nr:uncharacterized protein LOC123866151 isoform X4 [Maniola jurtina]